MTWAQVEGAPLPDKVARVAAVVGPIVAPFGFAAGQAGAGPRRAQVIFCRGLVGSIDGGCVDLVVDLEADPDWRIAETRYDGVSSWRLPAARQNTDFETQLASLVAAISEKIRHLDEH